MEVAHLMRRVVSLLQEGQGPPHIMTKVGLLHWHWVVREVSWSDAVYAIRMCEGSFNGLKTQSPCYLDM